jgi:SAM-dependent methyltransferase
MDKPFSPAAERNRAPILAVLREWFADRTRVLEVGSGTGQHAAHLVWQASDRHENLPGIRAWLAEARLANARDPIELDVATGWPQARYDAAYSANTLHIMSWPEVERMFAGLASVLEPDATLVVYGPFNIEGRFTSESNAAFDASLRAQLPHMGIRDREAVVALAQSHGMRLGADVPMPANNRCLVFRGPRPGAEV